MEIPRFDGTDALGWILKINHFLIFITLKKDKEFHASFCLEGLALNW